MHKIFQMSCWHTFQAVYCKRCWRMSMQWIYYVSLNLLLSIVVFFSFLIWSHGPLSLANVISSFFTLKKKKTFIVRRHLLAPCLPPPFLCVFILLMPGFTSSVVGGGVGGTVSAPPRPFRPSRYVPVSAATTFLVGSTTLFFCFT